ncbi:sodium/myo-inositol cotransporter-like isoform X2 [Acanthaster planci]|uniref:Sodium/myo-inositol cotransporter-like isoform X2 n=1 Tax=Acanthaster planci TaxID=133434 RepID=A0A8B7XSZ2_ACAPL|nr:sodium/myo-inositol cotransporter-like isoform X2 [Acanthaster planci]
MPEEAINTTLVAWDYVAIATYFVLVLCVGLFSLCRSNRGTVSGYFLAGRYMTWLPVGASLFASNIGSEHFVGLAGSGAAGGIGVGAFELNVYTLPEYMRKRFGGQRIRVYLAMLSLVLYIFTKISVNLFSGALFLQQALNWNIYLAVGLLLLLTAICTVTGGLAAVIYTDTLQFFIMLFGACMLMILSFIKIGGYGALKEEYMRAIPNETLYGNSSCGIPREDSWQMLRDPINSDMPWAGFLFGQTPASIWYWCADQMMVQRALSAKSLSHAQGGCLMAGYIKFLPLFLMVLPGMISRVLFTDEVACASEETCMAVCGSPSGCSNIAYPKLALGVLPVGLRGVMLAVMLAALMSDLTSIFNSTSTLFTIDIWKYFRAKCCKKAPSVRELMVVGRLVVVVMTVISILWIPVIQRMQGGQLFIYIQEISSFLAPPIAAVYLVALLWPRGNEKGAFWGLVVGFIVGVIRMILDFTYRAPPCWGVDRRPAITAKVHYMYFALILFWITVIVNVVVSLLTVPPQKQMLIRTTWWTRFEKGKRVDDFEDDKEEIELNDGLQVVTSEGQLETKRSLVRRGYDWFCGYDDTFAGRTKACQHRAHLREVSALKQDPRAKIFLNINLVLIILVASTLYVIFSIPGLL